MIHFPVVAIAYDMVFSLFNRQKQTKFRCLKDTTGLS